MSSQFRSLLKSLIKDKKLIALNDFDKTKVRTIEQYFSNSLPLSYKIFLEEVGDGVINGWEINGTAGEEEPSLIYFDKKIKANNHDIPENYILLLEDDELSWFFDTSTQSKKREFKIVPWIVGLSKDKQPSWLEKNTFSTFEDFFRNKILKPTEEEIFRMNYWKARGEQLETDSIDDNQSVVTAKNYLLQDIRTLYKNPMSPVEARKFMRWLMAFVVIVTLMLMLFGRS
ncbi:MAG TPA: SMI1/KNR4 family protein [Patescibacteria group bacterium]